MEMPNDPANTNPNTQRVVGDFFPLSPIAEALPRFIWNGIALNHWNSADQQVDLSEQPLHKALLALYPALTIPEIARLYKVLLEAQPDITPLFSEAVKLWGFRPSKDFFALLDRVLMLPNDFQNLISVKKMGVKDLSILFDLPIADCSDFFKLLGRSQLSRQELCNALETGGELILFKRAPNWKEFKGDLIEELKALRYPVSQSAEASGWWQCLDWPKGLRVRPVRNGDRLGIEISTQVYSHRDLAKLTQKLEKVHGHES